MASDSGPLFGHARNIDRSPPQFIGLFPAFRNECDRPHAEVPQYSRCRAIASGVIRVSGLYICLGLAKFLFIRNALDQGQVSVTFPFLIQPDDNPAARLFDHGLCRGHLFPARAFDAVKDVGTDTMRMDAAQHIFFVVNVTFYEGYGLLSAVVVKDLGERSELGLQVTLGESFDH